MVEISLVTNQRNCKKNVYLKMLKLSLGLCQKGHIELEGEQKKSTLTILNLEAIS